MQCARRILFLLVAVGCGANCPQSSNEVFPPPAEDDDELAVESDSESAAPQPVAQNEDQGPPCDIPIGSSVTEVKQRFGEPDATSQPQEIATEYHYYGKLLIIYRMNRVDDVILQEGGQCPD